MFASTPLKPGFDRDTLSRYGDSSWDLGPAVFRENARRCHVTAHFRVVEDIGVREAICELLYARLNIDIPGYRLRLPPASVRQVFNRARRFFEFVRSELGSVDLQRVDQSLLDSYARHLKSDRNRRSVVTGHLLEVITDLYAYREHLPSRGLRFQPWQYRPRRSTARTRGQAGSERQTRIIKP